MALGATSGVVRFLEERQVGYDWGVPNVRIPIVVGAVIDDLALGDGRMRVGPDEAYRACQAARPTPVAEGSVGAGTGATVGKMFVGRGMRGMKGGIGTASVRLGDVVIGALVVLNAAGDIVDWRAGTIVAGARTADGRGFARSVDVLRRDLESRGASAAPLADEPLRATTLAVVATNVALEQDPPDQAGDDGQHRRGARHQPVPHAGRRRSGACGVDRKSGARRVAHGAGRDRQRGRRRRDRARGTNGDERARVDGGPGPVSGAKSSTWRTT